MEVHHRHGPDTWIPVDACGEWGYGRLSTRPEVGVLERR